MHTHSRLQPGRLRGLGSWLFAVGAAAVPTWSQPAPLELAGVTVTPHVRAESMRYRRESTPEMGARVQWFLRCPAGGPLGEFRFNGRSADERLADKSWAWHDTPALWTEAERRMPPGSLMVWQFNQTSWEAGEACRVTRASATIEGGSATPAMTAMLERPSAWLSAVTFLSRRGEVRPDTLIAHIANESGQRLRLTHCRLYLPESQATYRFLRGPQELRDLECFPKDGRIASGDRGGFHVATPPLPLTYGALEVTLEDDGGRTVPLWAHLRIKRETFDLSGGWVAGNAQGRSTLTFEPFLKTLKRMHLNTAHLADVAGYTDQAGPDGLYTRYPLKYFNKLQPLATYDTDAMLPRIHAVEFLGEPQYGGGRPVPPMEVFKQLLPYASSRLATTVTHSEERVWRAYMGLCDYPHYDAYRVTAPSPDAWRKYERWEGGRLGWGAPLETIGNMCRSLREMSRPNPTAYWSQGAHAGWDVYDGRKRTSPTPDELRLQAYHALSTRITSLYWFNLSLPSLLKFRDLLDELTRVGREIRLLEEFYLTGDAYRYRQTKRGDRLDWDLASIAAPKGALLFALDLDYTPDPTNKVFAFKPPRDATFEFALPGYLRPPADVFRVDADGVHDVSWQPANDGVRISDRQHKVAVYVAALNQLAREELRQRQRELIAVEAAYQFDPAHNDADFATLQAILEKR